MEKAVEAAIRGPGGEDTEGYMETKIEKKMTHREKLVALVRGEVGFWGGAVGRRI